MLGHSLGRNILEDPIDRLVDRSAAFYGAFPRFLPIVAGHVDVATGRSPAASMPRRNLRVQRICERICELRLSPAVIPRVDREAR